MRWSQPTHPPRTATPTDDADSLEASVRLLEAVGHAVVAWDTDGLVTFMNRMAVDLYGRPRVGALGTHVAEVTRADMTPVDLDRMLTTMAEGRRWEGEVQITRADGSVVPVWTTNTPVYDGSDLIGHIGIAADMTERKASEALILYRASHDPLTDLATRQALAIAIDAHLDSPLRTALDLSLVLVDVGPLDTLNDTFGHAIGDRAILRCAHELESAVHPGDQLARFSDHTFGIWCPHSSDGDRALAYAERLRGVLARPFQLTGIDVTLQVFAAVALTDFGAVSAAELLQRANTALARARRDGATRAFDQTMQRELWRQVELEQLIDGVIALGDVSLGYQPIVRLADQRTVGAEALLRLVDDQGRPVDAQEAIGAAERSGRMSQLGELILRTACSAAARWEEVAPGREIGVAVNLSALQLDDPTLPERVGAALASSGLDPSALCLEVTEGTLMRDAARAAVLLNELKATGTLLSIDDFGTGFSSLAYLKRFPVDVLKIDKSFVAGLPEDDQDVAIARAILALAEAMGLAVVAEGVEDEAQLGGLLSLGAERAQGWLWSPAVTGSEFEARLVAEGAEKVPSA